MALGGYKFAGYKYTRPADYDSSVDAQVLAETLKMHKSKLKAFTDSCAASGAQWDFSYSSGDYAFGTHGNVIYKLDSSGFNLVSFFRYGTDNAYYAILTLNSACINSGDAALAITSYYRYYSGTTFNHSNFQNDMTVLSLIDLTVSNVSQWIGTNAMCANSYYPTAQSTTSNYILKSVPEYRYIGYAVKGKSIISFLKGNSDSTYYFKVESIDGFELSSPNDTYNIFCWTSSFTNTSSYVQLNSKIGDVQVLKDDGIVYEFGSNYNTSNLLPYIFFGIPQSAFSNAPTNNIPYESVLFTPYSQKKANFLNADGILTKGKTKIDLMAINNIYPNTNILPGRTFANGNYLCVCKVLEETYSANSTTINVGRIVYVGWDPSNPDITQESSWTAYTE